MIPLTQLQDMVFEIFVEFDRICRKHGITYSMEGGTLLGAVKYGDFVPWDDDIDVVMRREEYNRFLKVAPGELKKGLFLQSYENVKEFPLNYAKLCMDGTMICDYDYSHLKKMHHGIFMDIFPVDDVVPEKMGMQLHLVGALTGARKTKLQVDLQVGGKKKAAYWLLGRLPMNLLCTLQNRACALYSGPKATHTYEVCNSNRKFKPLPRQMYLELVELPFRDRKFLAVKSYDAFLKSRFGERYMEELPPEEQRKPSHNQNIVLTGE